MSVPSITMHSLGPATFVPYHRPHAHATWIKDVADDVYPGNGQQRHTRALHLLEGTQIADAVHLAEQVEDGAVLDGQVGICAGLEGALLGKHVLAGFS